MKEQNNYTLTIDCDLSDMLPLTSFISKCIRKASRLLLRDYFELENLQSVRSTIDFVKRSSIRAQETLEQELATYPRSCIINSNDASALRDKNVVYFKCNALSEEGAFNLSRAIPFFAMSVVAYSFNDDELVSKACVIYFPALGDMVYAESSRGAFIEKTQSHNNNHNHLRLKVSKIAEISDSVAVIDNLKYQVQAMRHVLSLGSSEYGGYMIASGKAEYMLNNNVNDVNMDAISLLVRESGGIVEIDKCMEGVNIRLICHNGKVKIT